MVLQVPLLDLMEIEEELEKEYETRIDTLDRNFKTYLIGMEQLLIQVIEIPTMF